MILKVRALDSDTWIFADGIKNVTSWKTTNRDDAIFQGAERFHMFAPNSDGEAATEVDVGVAQCEMQAGHEERFIFMPGFAFLLNDNGKTIERL